MRTYSAGLETAYPLETTDWITVKIWTPETVGTLLAMIPPHAAPVD